MCQADFRSKSMAKSSAQWPPVGRRSSRMWKSRKRRWRRLRCRNLRAAQLIARRAHRLDDVLIAGAAAQVRGQHVGQVFVADLRVLLQNVGRQHQKTRRAIAALQAVIDDDGAGAADAVLAADMGAGLAAVIADGVDQRLARLDADRIIAAVDGERDVGFFVHAGSLEHFSLAPNPLTPPSPLRGEGAASRQLVVGILTQSVPLTPPSPQRGERWGEGAPTSR